MVETFVINGATFLTQIQKFWIYVAILKDFVAFVLQKTPRKVGMLIMKLFEIIYMGTTCFT